MAKRRRRAVGLTLVELVLVMVISGILFATTPPLVFYGVKTMVFLPKALAANTVATEAMHQIIEGGFSTLQSDPVGGLRFAVRSLPSGGTASQPAIWLAEADRIGFLASNGQYVLIRLDTSVANAEVIKRSLPAASDCNPAIGAEEVIPYHAPGSVRIIPIGSLFRYYNQSGAEVFPDCPPAPTVRRVDMAFTAQTGNGNFDEGDAREDIASSVAVRVP